MRADRWVLTEPHAPYLFMIAVGEFAVTRDTAGGVPLSYYVEPSYEEHAEYIFGNSAEMLSFFSEILNYPYPWDKYAQMVVRECVSGAMENTTAVVFYDYVQREKGDIIDDNNEAIIAHELFHHWFGDFVTCESWANLVLNEGFATYGEYLWQEYKYGKSAAELTWLEEFQSYLNQARDTIHPLFYSNYLKDDDVFDQHSYNKGGLVLHMLRNYTGDDMFFKGLNNFLTKHAYQSVEIADLRLAFEEITGEDLIWFFDQWYFQAGHPIVEV